MKRFFALFFLLFTSVTIGSERPTIALNIRHRIVSTSTIDHAAQLFNQLVENGTIAPMVANIHWCINTLLDKAVGPEIHTLKLAQKLAPGLAQLWLANFLHTSSGFANASSNLKQAIEQNNQTLAAFILSTKNIRLANTTFYNDSSPTYLCAISNRAQIMSHLLEAGANCKTYPSWGRAPIHVAATQGFIDIVKTLLDYGADPDYIDSTCSYTPLMLLCYQTSDNSIEIAKLLLNAGADINKNYFGHTALKLLEQQQERESANQLRQFLLTYNPKKKIA